MQSKNYFERILCSERLPDKTGSYITNLGKDHLFDKKMNMFLGMHPEWWQPNEPATGYLLSEEELYICFKSGENYGAEGERTNWYEKMKTPNFNEWIKQKETNNG